MFAYGNILYPVDLTSNFSVLCTNVKVYLHTYSYWVEPTMNIHEGKGLKQYSFNNLIHSI